MIQLYFGVPTISVYSNFQIKRRCLRSYEEASAVAVTCFGHCDVITNMETSCYGENSAVSRTQRIRPPVSLGSRDRDIMAKYGINYDISKISEYIFTFYIIPEIDLTPKQCFSLTSVITPYKPHSKAGNQPMMQQISHPVYDMNFFN